MKRQRNTRNKVKTLKSKKSDPSSHPPVTGPDNEANRGSKDGVENEAKRTGRKGQVVDENECTINCSRTLDALLIGIRSEGELIKISEDEWWDTYQPIPNLVGDGAEAGWSDGDDQGRMFETYGKELEFLRAQDPCTIWTLLECDGNNFVVSGYHHTNRLGYFITKKPVEEGKVLWWRVPGCDDED